MLSVQFDELLVVSISILHDGINLDPVCSHLLRLMTTISDPLSTTHSHVTLPLSIVSIARRLSIGLVVANSTSTDASWSSGTAGSSSMAMASLMDAESTHLAVTSWRSSFWTSGERAIMSLADRVTGRLSRCSRMHCGAVISSIGDRNLLYRQARPCPSLLRTMQPQAFCQAEVPAV